MKLLVTLLLGFTYSYSKIGINPDHLRSRQHMAIEMMAHYAWIAGMSRYTIPGVGRNVLGVLIERHTIFRSFSPNGSSASPSKPFVSEKGSPEWNKKILGKSFKQDAGMAQLPSKNPALSLWIKKN